MGYIEKLLDYLEQIGGERVFFPVDELPFAEKGGQRLPLGKKVLSPEERGVVEREILSLSQGHERFTLKERPYLFYRREKGLEILRSRPQDPAVAPQPVPPREESLPRTVEASSQSVSPSASSPVGGGEERRGGTEPSFRLLPLFHEMLKRKASDLHLSTLCPPYLRVDGDMASLERPPFTEEELMAGVEEFTPQRNLKELAETNDTDFAVELIEGHRFRANLFRDRKGLCAVFRHIPSKILTPEEIKLPSVILDLCLFPKGLVLVTGPTGSGKSTTLASMIHWINQREKKHIITVEDPIEFVHENELSLVNQREVQVHTASFKRALKAALREDPDIILVGEMRDLETIAIAIEMAVTGHLVFGTLHTSTAIGTVDRIIDQFPSGQQAQIRTMLADALIGVVSQMLCKKEGGGRVGAYEVLVVNPAVSNCIREGKNFQIATLMQTGKSMGMRSMNDSLQELVESTLISPDEALNKALDKENLKRSLAAKKFIPAP